MQTPEKMDVTTQVKCTKCGSQAHEMNRDLMSKSYKCPGCGDVFTRKANLFNSKRIANMNQPQGQ